MTDYSVLFHGDGCGCGDDSAAPATEETPSTEEATPVEGGEADTTVE